jgi:O-antigen ligase
MNVSARSSRAIAICYIPSPDDRMAKKSETLEPESALETTLGWLVIVLAFSLPLYRPWVSLATTAILVLWLFAGFMHRARTLRGHRLTIAVLVFLGINIASLAWTSDPASGLKYLTKYRYFLLLPMIASTVRPIYRRSAVSAFEVAAGLSVVLSVGVYTGWFRLRDAHPDNPSPTMAHLDFGILLALASLLVLTRVLYTKMPVSRRCLWACLAVFTTLGLAINIGLAGQIAFVGGLMVLVVHWAWDRPARTAVGVIAGFAVALAVIWCFVPQTRSKVAGVRAELDAALIDEDFHGNLGGRIAAMKVAREVFQKHPILGTGVGGNMPAFRRELDSRFEKLKPSIYWYPHYHNQYAQIATELGTIGLLSLAWVFWELIRLPRQRRETDAAALMLATVYLLGFLGEPYFHKQITLVMFALFAGLISAEDLWKTESTEDSGTSFQGVDAG